MGIEEIIPNLKKINFNTNSVKTHTTQTREAIYKKNK